METAMEYKARRHREAQERIRAENQAIEEGRYRLLGKLAEPPPVSEVGDDGLMSCCGAPADEDLWEATGKYRARHRLGTKKYSQSNLCDPARLMWNWYSQANSRRWYRKTKQEG